MAEYLIQSETLNAIANAINTKTGGSSAMTPAQMATAIGNIPSGGGIEMGLEVVSFNAKGRVSEYLWHGETVPPYAFQYNWHNGTPPTIHFADSVTDVGDYGFGNAYCWVDFSELQYLATAGNAAFAFQGNANTTEGKEINLPSYTGLRSDGGYSGETFRIPNNTKYIKKMFFPKMQYIGDYVWYQRSVPDSVIEIGSVGYPLLSVNQRPFGSSSGVGTVTVYTTGALLDTIKTAIQNQASASYTWIYKAAEATEYGGVSYAAGDTMLTVGGA